LKKLNLWRYATPQVKRCSNLLFQNDNDLDDVLEKTDLHSLYSITRELHIKIHLDEIDKDVRDVTLPRRYNKDQADALDSQLILQSFLDYLHANGPDDFGRFVNTSILRLVSTVHPNETERNTNLMHYTSLQEKYVQWRKVRNIFLHYVNHVRIMNHCPV
jgi:phosphoenolpyruvate carboxylase